jgi:hypothetical protein
VPAAEGSSGSGALEGVPEARGVDEVAAADAHARSLSPRALSWSRTLAPTWSAGTRSSSRSVIALPSWPLAPATMTISDEFDIPVVLGSYGRTATGKAELCTEAGTAAAA